MTSRTTVRRGLRRLAVAVAAILATAAAVVGNTAPATAATGLWHCQPFGSSHGWRACTTITAAPPTGVVVWDWHNGVYKRFYNGYNVSLWMWGIDTSNKCGVSWDQYVWWIQWTENGVRRDAYIGDRYLNTGNMPNWNTYNDWSGRGVPSNLGNNEHYMGTGEGSCGSYH